MEYELTDDGERAYFTLLCTALSHRDPDSTASPQRSASSPTSRAEAIDLLRPRAQAMVLWRASITGPLPPDTNLDPPADPAPRRRRLPHGRRALRRVTLDRFRVGIGRRDPEPALAQLAEFIGSRGRS